MLLQAESVVFPVAFPTSGRRRQSSSRKESGFCCVRVEQSSRVFGIVVVDFLSGSKSQNSHSEKFHFFTSFGFEVGIWCHSTLSVAFYAVRICLWNLLFAPPKLAYRWSKTKPSSAAASLHPPWLCRVPWTPLNGPHFQNAVNWISDFHFQGPVSRDPESRTKNSQLELYFVLKFQTSFLTGSTCRFFASRP